MSDEAPRLRLFVVMESSGNPRDWSDYGTRILVLAKDAEEARSLTDYGQDAPCALVSASEPCILTAQDCGPL